MSIEEDFVRPQTGHCAHLTPETVVPWAVAPGLESSAEKKLARGGKPEQRAWKKPKLVHWADSP